MAISLERPETLTYSGEFRGVRGDGAECDGTAVVTIGEHGLPEVRHDLEVDGQVFASLMFGTVEGARKALKTYSDWKQITIRTESGLFISTDKIDGFDSSGSTAKTPLVPLRA